MYPGEFMFYHQDGIGSEIQEVKKGEYFTSISDSRKPSKVKGAIGFVPPFADLSCDIIDGRQLFVKEIQKNPSPATDSKVKNHR